MVVCARKKKTNLIFYEQCTIDQWLHMARDSYQRLSNYVNQTVVPNVLTQFGFTGSAADQIHETINWRFFDQIPKNIPNLLNALQRLLSETKYEKPFLETIEMLARDKSRIYDEIITASALVNLMPAQKSTGSEEEENIVFKEDDGIMEHRSNVDVDIVEQPPPPLPTNPAVASVFVYSFQHSNTMDLRGKINYFGGASHSADLLFLMGPSLYQQIGRRRLSQSEEKLCKRMRSYWADFVKTGNPTPGRLFSDAWQPYTRRRRYIHLLGVASSVLDPNDNDIATVLDRNRVPIAEMISVKSDGTDSATGGDEYSVGSGNRKFDVSRMPKSYLPEVNDSEYYRTIGRVSAFWNELLPRIQRKQTRWDDLSGGRGSIGNETDLEYLSNDVGSKFKHAFFSMLVLVCLLLGILGVCVYILQKSPRGIDTSYL